MRDAHFLVQVAAILRAGVTVYKGLKVTEARPGDWVVVSGIGGLGHMAVQYARAMGLHVAAVDVEDEKLDLARRLGATVAVSARTADPVTYLKEEIGGADGVLVTASSPKAFEQALGMVRRGGTIVLTGLRPGSTPLPIFDVLDRGITLCGSIVGTRLDLQEALAFAGEGAVKAKVQTERARGYQRRCSSRPWARDGRSRGALYSTSESDAKSSLPRARRSAWTCGGQRTARRQLEIMQTLPKRRSSTSSWWTQTIEPHQQPARIDPRAAPDFSALVDRHRTWFRTGATGRFVIGRRPGQRGGHSSFATGRTDKIRKTRSRRSALCLQRRQTCSRQPRSSACLPRCRAPLARPEDGLAAASLRAGCWEAFCSAWRWAVRTRATSRRRSWPNAFCRHPMLRRHALPWITAPASETSEEEGKSAKAEKKGREDRGKEGGEKHRQARTPASSPHPSTRRAARRSLCPMPSPWRSSSSRG